MNTENLISLADFAKQANIPRCAVTRLITPQTIEPTIIGNRKFIDTSKYNPKDYSKKQNG